MLIMNFITGLMEKVIEPNLIICRYLKDINNCKETIVNRIYEHVAGKEGKTLSGSALVKKLSPGLKPDRLLSKDQRLRLTLNQ